MLAHEKGQLLNAAKPAASLSISGWAIEIKRSDAPDLSKGVRIAADDVQATQRFVVHLGEGAFPIGEQVKRGP